MFHDQMEGVGQILPRLGEGFALRKHLRQLLKMAGKAALGRRLKDSGEREWVESHGRHDADAGRFGIRASVVLPFPV